MKLALLGLSFTLGGCGPLATFGAIELLSSRDSIPVPMEAPPKPALLTPPWLLPLIVVEARLVGTDPQWGGDIDYSGHLTIEDDEGTLTLDALEYANFQSRGWRITSGSLDAVAQLVGDHGRSARLEITRTFLPSPIPAELVANWRYVAEALGSEPIYDERPEGLERSPRFWEANTKEWKKIEGAEDDELRKPGLRRALVRAAIEAQTISRSDGRWEDEIEKAIKAGDDELAFAMYRYFRPMGRCSMDMRPAEIAREYLALCEKHHRTGCVLQLQLQIMGDRFSRTAYSSYGEAAHETASKTLADAGIDVDRYFLGLMVTGTGRTRLGEIGTHRLGRAIREAGRAAALEPIVRAWAENPKLDELNRFRAAMVLASLRSGDEEPFADLAKLRLGDFTRSLVEKWRAEASRRAEARHREAN